jgi:hypothetical protein
MRRRTAIYVLVGILAIVAVAWHLRQSNPSVRASRTGPADVGDLFCIDASYDGNPANPGDYSWNLHLVGLKSEFGKGWFIVRPGTPSAKRKDISIPKRLAAFESAVHKWRLDDPERRSPDDPKHIRIEFLSSGMQMFKTIAYDRSANSSSPRDNDMRDLIWGCLDDLRAADGQPH